MGETFLDGKPIGLWNYRQREGDCKGCVVRYADTFHILHQYFLFMLVLLPYLCLQFIMGVNGCRLPFCVFFFSGLWSVFGRRMETLENLIIPLCSRSPQRTDGEGTVQLDGEGYAAVGRPTRWNPNVSTITFKFRTFSSDSLLMYLATEDMVCLQQRRMIGNKPARFMKSYNCHGNLLLACIISIYWFVHLSLLMLLFAEGLYVSWAVRRKGEDEFWPGVRSWKCPIS